MTLEETVVLLDFLRQRVDIKFLRGDVDAIKLGIAALKREKHNRENPDYVMVGPLPGETE